MTNIADSSAIKDEKRILPQHQAALTLLQGRLSDPKATLLTWLDLACGRGQILNSLKENLSEDARNKISYFPFDINNQYTIETCKTASTLGFQKLTPNVGDLYNFDQILPKNQMYDFITLTNTTHEIDPNHLAPLLVSCVTRLNETGTLYIYDMEKIKPPELGAMPWSRDNMRQIIFTMLNSFGVSNYQPEICLWTHRTCNGWNVQLQRQHFQMSLEDTFSAKNNVISILHNEIQNILISRYRECRASLNNLTIFGAETPNELEDKELLLYEFWSISRALEIEL